ncbi:sulfotransferase family 2 domain-containing protein [Silicimonas sp. MF1-12-2]|uniref:sulfotransferase family 2 domain-containing protein n=1 Tax=Silicimonas sp. MF1-12-2 TaxID=3384793 RepID=UPI0039B64991
MDRGVDMLRHVAQTHLPSGVYRYQQLKRRTAVFLDAGIVFIHVPKNAGTSISLAVYGRFVGHVRSSDVDRWGNAQLKALPRFSVVRNPWDRCYSAYRFAIADRSGDAGRGLEKISRPERYNRPEFATFSRFLHEWLVMRDLSAVDQVFRPQVVFLKNRNGQMNLEFTGRVEQMDAVAAYLTEKLGRPIVIGRKNATARPGHDYRAHYSPEDRDLVGRIYSEDVEAFNYDF